MINSFGKLHHMIFNSPLAILLTHCNANICSLFQAVGNAPTKAYHSCNLFCGELLVFGGVFPNPDPEPDGCSNELYIFNTGSNNWYKPITRGTPPKPKSG